MAKIKKRKVNDRQKYYEDQDRIMPDPNAPKRVYKYMTEKQALKSKGIERAISKKDRLRPLPGSGAGNPTPPRANVDSEEEPTLDIKVTPHKLIPKKRKKVKTREAKPDTVWMYPPSMM